MPHKQEESNIATKRNATRNMPNKLQEICQTNYKEYAKQTTKKIISMIDNW